MISAVVLTKNEENNIARCLKSLSFCDEIIVVDDNSIDLTIKKIGSKAKIFKRNLDGDFAKQHNFAMEKAKGDWVLSLDADEVVSKKLAEEITEKTYRGDYDGFMIKRRDFFWGRFLKFGETGNIRILRLAKKNVGSWTRKVHEVWEIQGKVGQLNNPILHYAHPSLFQFISSINHYTDLDIIELKKEGKSFSFFRLLANPIGKFIQNYFFRLGILDGSAGFVMAFMMSLYSLIVRVKLYENSI